MARLGRPGLPEARKKELWERWKAGESISDIARALKKPPGSIHGMLKATGGIAPPRRCRPRWVLSLTELEEISRGLASGEPMRTIATRLGRSASTVSRKVGRNGGRKDYRAAMPDEKAWERARRSKRCLLTDALDWRFWLQRVDRASSANKPTVSLLDLIYSSLCKKM